MNRVTKIIYKTSFGFSLLIFFAAFVFAYGVHASNFTFTKTEIQIDNSGNVQNNTQTISNSGGNTTTTTGGSSTVNTGNAGSQTIICNDVNHTVINANSGQSCPSAVNPTVAPTTIPPTPMPTSIPGGCSNCGGNNGGSSGNSGSSNSSGSSSSSPSQAVLGTSTLGATGTFDATVMNSLFGLGTLLLGGGYLSYRKERKS